MKHQNESQALFFGLMQGALSQFPLLLLLSCVTDDSITLSPESVLKQYKQPAEQKELGLQVMSKASRTVPDVGEMLHEGGLGSEGASVVTPGSVAGSVGSGPGTGRVYLAKPGSFLPVKKKKKRKHIFKSICQFLSRHRREENCDVKRVVSASSSAP